jgi:hypothetical protein
LRFRKVGKETKLDLGLVVEGDDADVGVVRGQVKDADDVIDEIELRAEVGSSNAARLIQHENHVSLLAAAHCGI